MSGSLRLPAARFGGRRGRGRGPGGAGCGGCRPRRRRRGLLVLAGSGPGCWPWFWSWLLAAAVLLLVLLVAVLACWCPAVLAVLRFCVWPVLLAGPAVLALVLASGRWLWSPGRRRPAGGPGCAALARGALGLPSGCAPVAARCAPAGRSRAAGRPAAGPGAGRALGLGGRVCSTAGCRRAGRWCGSPGARCRRRLAGAAAALAGGCRPPDWAALIASTSCAFFMEPAPVMPMPPAIALRSASSMELSPPPRFLRGAPRRRLRIEVSVT